jgi:hypothetical protein
MWRRREGLLLSCGIILLTQLIYYPVHKYPFIDYDDGQYVYNNPHILASLTWQTIRWAFTHTYVFNYDPLIFLAHRVNVLMFGLNPGLQSNSILAGYGHAVEAYDTGNATQLDGSLEVGRNVPQERR